MVISMKRFLAPLMGLVLTGCVTSTQNIPNPTATEQLLVSHSAERAAAGMNLRLPPGSVVFLDTGNLVTANDHYVAEAVAAHMRGHGLVLLDTKDKADYVVSLRISADSIDDLNRVLGVPATTIPSLQNGVPAVNIPEIAIFSKHQRHGIVELSATATDRTGRLVAAVGPIFGISKIVSDHVLAGFVSGDVLARPGIQAERK